MTSTEVAKTSPGGLVAEYRKDFAMVLPSHVDGDQWVRMVQGLMRRNPALAHVAQKNPGSFLSALLDCASKGLEPGTTYHLVPFGSEVVGITDWKGELDLVLRSGAVSSVKCEVVYERDEFRFDTSMDRPIHNADWFADRGEMIGGYAYAVMKDGTVSRVVIMSRAQIEDVRSVSKTAHHKDSIWQRWPDRAWRKTLLKALAKWLPQSAEYREAVLRSAAAIESVNPALTVQEPTKDYDDPDFDDDDVVDAEIVDDEDSGDAPGTATGMSEPDEGVAPGPSPSGAAPDDFEPMTQAQGKALHAVLRHTHNVTGDARFPFLTKRLGRTIASTNEISKDEASRLLDDLQDGGAPDAETAA